MAQYASRDDIDELRLQMAQAIIGGLPDSEPIRHWTQDLAPLADAFGPRERQDEERDAANAANAERVWRDAMPVINPPPPSALMPNVEPPRGPDGWLVPPSPPGPAGELPGPPGRIAGWTAQGFGSEPPGFSLENPPKYPLTYPAWQPFAPAPSAGPAVVPATGAYVPMNGLLDPTPFARQPVTLNRPPPAAALFDPAALGGGITPVADQRPAAPAQIGYGDRPLGVRFSEIGRMSKADVPAHVDARLAAYRNATDRATKNEALDRALDAAYAWRVQGGRADPFQRIADAVAVAGDDQDALTVRVMRKRADAIVGTGIFGNIRSFNDNGENFGAKIHALQHAITQDPDSAYGIIWRALSVFEHDAHTGVGTTELGAFKQAMSALGYGRELQAAAFARAQQQELGWNDERAALARMTPWERMRYAVSKGMDAGEFLIAPGLAMAIAPGGRPPGPGGNQPGPGGNQKGRETGPSDSGLNIKPPEPKDAVAQSKPCEIRPSELGDRIGGGGEKDVHAYGENQVVGVVRADAKRPPRITEELAVLKQLRDVGMPVVDAQPVTVGGRPGVLMDRYEVGSKDISPKTGKGWGSEFLNERSVSDLNEIKRLMVEKKVWINDLQFLIGKDGRVVVADPIAVEFGRAPSRANKDVINALIRKASEKGPSK